MIPAPQMRKTLWLTVLAGVLAAGCATAPGPVEAPVESRQSPPLPQAATPGTPSSSSPSAPSSSNAPRRPPAASVPAAPTVPAPPSAQVIEAQARALAQELLPPAVGRERAGWAADIANAFGALRLAPSVENVCAAMAIIEQESSFRADPEVPGLARMAWKEIEARRESHHIPKLALDAALGKTSPDGRTYRQRIDSLRTERQMSLIYSDIIDEVPGGKLLLSGYNPVRTGGPMQVSVAFAQEHAKEKPYGIALSRELGGDLRNAVFTRRGGLYFGIAHLLDYPAPYREPIHRFADFNAGRYSSRNAAFQQALGRLSGQSLTADGDLLNYENGAPSSVPSATLKAVLGLSGRLRMSGSDIVASLRLEKTEAFGRTLLYQRLFALADEAAGRPLPREAMPQIDLKSPKIRSKITTAWFAERVNMRYRLCLQRASQPAPPPTAASAPVRPPF
ncbi:MAG TPA: DUF1615 domain-containing protein [Azospira sp.]|nr:DUF1615 domain-containing protein [Azospira sp.]